MTKVTVWFRKREVVPDDWKRLGEMLQEGFTQGIGQPPGMDWTLEEEKAPKKKPRGR